MDITFGEAFAIIDMDVDGEQDTASEPEAHADGRVEEEGQVEAEGQVDGVDFVLIRANIGATEVHTVGATLEELYKQHDKEVLGYKARISFLESRVAALNSSFLASSSAASFCACKD